MSKGQQQDGSVFERRITINQQDQTLDFILEQISWQAGVYFSYDASIIDSESICSLSAENKSLYTVLHQVLPHDKYVFKELDNQIIIRLRNTFKLSPEAPKDTIPTKFIFLSGKLVEDKKGRPVKYASISVFNKPIGTISNTDGDFILKLHPDHIRDTIIISSMGYAQITMPAFRLLDEDLFILRPVSIKIREVKVTSTTADKLLTNFWNNLDKNYSSQSKLMTSFYRETVRQDASYISVSEAVVEVLKSPYQNTRSDLVRIIKGRKSRDVQPFRWLNFKLMGGPFTITQLDAVKTMESFLDKDYRDMYKYSIDRVIWYNNHPVYVLKFYPLTSSFFPLFEGEMFVHRETFALVHANYQLTKTGLEKAKDIMIKKKPRKVKARPTYVKYTVNYQHYQGRWQLATAQASAKFKVRSKRDKLNSEFHSISDLLITDIKSTSLKRFTKDENFNSHDIFVEELGKYDEVFWENYNIKAEN